MSRICVVTGKSRAYYAIVSRLRRAGLPFRSLVPGPDVSGCDMVITTADEAPSYSGTVLRLEALDKDPEVFKGQLVAELEGKDLGLRVGVDPGARTGFAVYYGETILASHTYTSASSVAAKVAAFAEGMPSAAMVVRVGNGDRQRARKLAEAVQHEAPGVRVELVDESGTSVRSGRTRRVPLDQSSAARIAFRKGEPFNQPRPRSRE